ncbi:two-component system nitrate/nitrite response regulator NarL [Novosphingobium sp. PhB165]|uniref:LuxR C-terminal-related transcriptional regulator n=1 Tax=Novosphingobium sp. PhB165 TaxID=2485105 RepID=UPI0010438AB0|nr:response regulator transcription factor [Novosphingobium sp. PhB165]TCM20853.1 two-component system nitrate/nitrite response regulator NarL [Novosphingobium sp. PhB165]
MSITMFVAMKNSLAQEGMCRILADSALGTAEPLRSLAALAPALAGRHEEAILVIDRSICGADGAATLGNLLLRYPRLRIVVLVESFEFSEMAALYMAGAHAYFLIDSPCQSLVSMMQMVAIGQRVAPPEIIDMVDNMLVVTSRGAPQSASVEDYKFNTRELDVLASLRNGLQNKTIAYDLNVTEAAIKATVKSILTKLGARNRTQAAVMAREMSLCEPRPRYEMSGENLPRARSSH